MTVVIPVEGFEQFAHFVAGPEHDDLVRIRCVILERELRYIRIRKIVCTQFLDGQVRRKKAVVEHAKAALVLTLHLHSLSESLQSLQRFSISSRLHIPRLVLHIPRQDSSFVTVRMQSDSNIAVSLAN